MGELKSSSIKSWGQKFIAIIFTLIALPILPFPLLLVVLPILSIRKIVASLAPIFHPEFSKILTHRSTNLCLEEFHAHTENVILMDSISEGNCSLETFKNLFTERVLLRKLPNGELKYPELRQFVVKWMDFKFWKNEDNFDINDHVRLYNESRPSGSDEFVTEKEFHQMRSTLMNSAFPENKSPWEIVVVHNYVPSDPILRARTDKPLTVFTLKMQHSLGDGFSLKKLVALNFSENQHLEKDSVKKPFQPEMSHSSCWAAGLSCLTFPIRALYEFMHISVQLMKKGPWHVAKGKEAPAVHVFSRVISVARVKWIKDQLGVSFTCILFHVCNEAVRKMMMRKGMELSDSLVAIIPLPLPNHPDKLRNHMTHAAIQLPTSPELTPTQRLKIIHKNYQQLKSSTLPLSAAWLSLIVGGMFTSIGRLLARGLVPPIVISSFPGPSHSDFTLDKQKVLSVYANAGLLNLSGLALMILTYADDLRFAVTANSNILNEDDALEFANILEREINILEEEIIPKLLSVAAQKS